MGGSQRESRRKDMSEGARLRERGEKSLDVQSLLGHGCWIGLDHWGFFWQSQYNRRRRNVTFLYIQCPNNHRWHRRPLKRTHVRFPHAFNALWRTHLHSLRAGFHLELRTVRSSTQGYWEDAWVRDPTGLWISPAELHTPSLFTEQTQKCVCSFHSMQYVTTNWHPIRVLFFLFLSQSACVFNQPTTFQLFHTISICRKWCNAFLFATTSEELHMCGDIPLAVLCKCKWIGTKAVDTTLRCCMCNLMPFSTITTKVLTKPWWITLSFRYINICKMEMDETFKKLLSSSSLYFKDLLCIIISAIIFGSPEACQISHSVLILDLNSG